MRFIFLVHLDREKMAAMTPAEQAALDRESLAYDTELAESGHLIAAGPLEEPENATLLRIRDGKLSMTDGAYVETKEHLGGFVLIEARDREEALALASKGSIARYGTIEVREGWALKA